MKRKIEEVIKSYKNLKKKSEFFIQDMVKNIKISGVVLTRDLESYLPCYNINYYIGKDSSQLLLKEDQEILFILKTKSIN